MGDCKHECDLGKLLEFRDDQKSINQAILDQLKKIDHDLNNGLKSDMAVIKSKCNGLAWTAGFRAFLCLLPVVGVISAAVYFAAK